MIERCIRIFFWEDLKYKCTASPFKTKGPRRSRRKALSALIMSRRILYTACGHVLGVCCCCATPDLALHAFRNSSSHPPVCVSSCVVSLWLLCVCLVCLVVFCCLVCSRGQDRALRSKCRSTSWLCARDDVKMYLLSRVHFDPAALCLLSNTRHIHCIPFCIWEISPCT